VSGDRLIRSFLSIDNFETIPELPKKMAGLQSLSECGPYQVSTISFQSLFWASANAMSSPMPVHTPLLEFMELHSFLLTFIF
jgi:hypothetical protein